MAWVTSIQLVLVILCVTHGHGCRTDDECVHNSQCPLFIQLREEWEQLDENTPKYEEKKAKLRGMRCDGVRRVCCCKQEQCVSIQQCPSIQDDYKDYLGNDPSKKRAALEKIRSLVCDKDKNLICCPRTRNSSPVTTKSLSSSPCYLPSLGDCGVSGDSQRIVGGERTRPGEVPWAALLGKNVTQVKRINGNIIRQQQIRWSCGGVLINNWFVLTAAHCQGKKKNQYITRLRLGEFTVCGYSCHGPDPVLPQEQDFVIRPQDVTVHPQYSSLFRDSQGNRNIKNDIALIKLPRPARRNAGVQFICLPISPIEYRRALGVSNIEDDLEGAHATVVGWGYTSGFDPWTFEDQQDTKNYGIPSRVQNKLSVPILNENQCEQDGDWRIPLPTQVCAGGEKDRDSCQGDSGGGLFIRKQYDGVDTDPLYLLGIVSYGSKYCGIGRPGMYTRVEKFIPWIKDVINYCS